MTSVSHLSDLPPLYTARSFDIETTSVRSAAPSYTSAAPSYHSGSGTLPAIAGSDPAVVQHSSHHLTARIAPSRRQASNAARASRDGNRNTWRAARPRLVVEPDVRACNIPSWSSVRSSHQEKLYRSVAHRRTSAAAASAAAAAAAPPSGMGSLRPRASTICCENILEEDPYVLLGGEAAAERARMDRLTKKQRDDEALAQEGRSWDFMLKQMADWDAREKSWTKFRREAEKPGLFRGRNGLLGLAMGRVGM